MTTPTAQEKPSIARLFSGIGGADESDLYKCVHCGFCLQVCPTYLETGLETESPRGRIALMKGVNEGRIEMTDSVMRHWDLCIQCRACEVACPSGVPYGKLIETTMAEVAQRRKQNSVKGLVGNAALKWILPEQGRLSKVVGAARLYQNSGLQNLVRRSGLLKRISPDLAEMESSMPKIPATTFRASGQVIPATGGEKTRRVALLSGCVMPLVNGPQMNAVVRVLTRNGVEVVVPKNQGCCGAINSHVGDLSTARELARRNIDGFLAEDVDAIVVASAGCGSRMKEYHDLLKDDTEYAEKAAQLSDMVEDIHEFLVDIPFEVPTASLDYRVTYQDSCHLANAQRVTASPRQILKSIPGIEFVELPNASICCGGGGTYTITEREFSLKILKTKMDAVAETGADIIATANPGCLMQLQMGAGRHKMPIEVRYVTDLLDEAYLKQD
ncbi:MAG: (Fe-S)-binding protein [Chloroflexi bacterium]|nr:(Fe-S)-binding protein [Chloroflexota bacterium]